jgi:hypothetical protein
MVDPPGEPSWSNDGRGAGGEKGRCDSVSCRERFTALPYAPHRRSTSGFEVDFLLSDHTAIEVKATHSVSGADLRSLRALREDVTLKHCLLVSLEPRPRIVDGISILPVRTFLDALWSGAYI